MWKSPLFSDDPMHIGLGWMGGTEHLTATPWNPDLATN